jgi:hypothetical protein
MGRRLLGGSQFLEKRLRSSKILKTFCRRQLEHADEQREVNPEILGSSNPAARRRRCNEPD